MLSLVPRLPRLALLATTAALALGTGLATLGASPAPQDESLARYVPAANDLFFLLEFDGLGADPDAWHRTATYRLLTETGLGATLEDLIRQAIARGIEATDEPPTLGGAEVTPDQMIDAARFFLDQGGIVAVAGDPNGTPRVVFVARGVAGPDADPTVARLLEEFRKDVSKDAQEETRGNRTLMVDPNGNVASWAEGADFVVSNDADAVIATLDGKSPSIAGGDLLSGIGSQAEGFVPVLRGFVDVDALPEMPADAKAMGLDGLDRVEMAWGFQGDALRTEIRVEAPAPRKGLLSLIDQPTFDAGTLPPLPPDLGTFTVLSVDLEKTYDTIIAVAGSQNPEAPQQVAAFEETLKQQLGIDLRKQLLSQLGPRIAVHSRPDQGAKINADALIPPDAVPQGEGGELIRSMLAAQVAAYGGLTYLVELKDRDGFVRAVDQIINIANVALGQAMGPDGPELRIDKQGGDFPVYSFRDPARPAARRRRRGAGADPDDRPVERRARRHAGTGPDRRRPVDPARGLRAGGRGPARGHDLPLRFRHPRVDPRDHRQPARPARPGRLDPGAGPASGRGGGADPPRAGDRPYQAARSGGRSRDALPLVRCPVE